MRSDRPRRTGDTGFDRAGSSSEPGRSDRLPPRPAVVVPDLPPEVTAAQLDPAVKRELRSLAKATAETVAGQLVAAGTLLGSDPQAALAHARAARRIASRVASVREAAGLAAYAAGEYAEALSELRAHRRMSGLAHHVPMMADCERALGRPAKALELLAEAPVAELPAAARAELLLVRSGAHRDLGQQDEALAVLEVGELDSATIKPWTARLWYGYADALVGVGREHDAAEWFTAVAAVDDGETDADERAAELSGSPAEGDCD
jgi:tetratricopeptide (TPR) repeat protein